jgi:hypothetical protein
MTSATGTRKLQSKEIQQDADAYMGSVGELWFQEGTTQLRFGDSLTPGGIPLGGSAGPVDQVCVPGSATVIYTASSSNVGTVRITAQAVGFETGVIDFVDTHSADIMAIKNLRTGLAEASVYGVTYTSVNPLVTFDAQITDGVLEITAEPISLTNSITINTSGIEITA